MKRKIVAGAGLVTLAVGGFFSCKKAEYKFDNGYSSGVYEDTVSLDVDTNRFKIDYSKYTQARSFPGLCGADEPRMENFLVAVDLDYVESSNQLRISQPPGAWQSTAMWAPAGELIVIDVPAGIYGLTAQIGPWTYDASSIENSRRDPVVYSRQILFPGKNYMRNLYGGLVYIIPEKPLGKVVDLHFSGTVQAPSFVLGETTDAQWHEMIEKTTVPWFELVGKRMIFTLETVKLKQFPIQSPTELMQTWDYVIRSAYWDWTGLTEGNPDPKHRAPFNQWRVVHDIQLSPGAAQVSGYPVRAQNTNGYFQQAVTVDMVKTSNWGTYHELGHNMQQGSVWSFDGNGETSNNLFSFKVANLFGHKHTKYLTAWPIAKAWVEKATKVWPTATYDAELPPDGKIMMYAQLFEKYGYEFMTYLYTRARNARFTSANNQSKIDFFYEALCEYTHIDMEPFLREGWGITVSSVSKRYIKETLRLPLLDKKVWLYNPINGEGGDEAYFPTIPPTEITSANPVEELSKTGWAISASNYNTGYVPDNMIDGKAETFWNACWGGSNCSGASYSIRSWTVDLTLPSTGLAADGLVIMQRNQENSNNHLRYVKVEISADGETYNEIGVYDLARVTTNQFLSFEGTMPVKAVRLSIEGSYLYNTADYPVIAEIGLFKFK